MRRVPVVVAIVLVTAGAVALDQTIGARTRSRGAVAERAPGPAIPSPRALSVAWYCAEGTSASDGRADETVIVANLGDREAEAVVTVMSGTEEPRRDRVDVPAFGQVAVDVADVLEAPEQLQSDGTLLGPGVVVEVLGGPAVVEHVITRGDDLAMGPCARGPARDWYFSAGTTVQGVEHVLALFNPFGDDAIVDVTFLTDVGVQAPDGVQSLVVPRRSRVAILVHEQLRRQAQVAALVSARSGRIVAEQSVAFDGSEGPRGLALSLGATAPGTSWSLPFGTRVEGRAETVTLANFAPRGTEVALRTLVDGEGEPDSERVPVPGRSVVVADVGTAVAPDSRFALDVRVDGGGSVVVEALDTGPDGVFTEMGIPLPSRRWAFAGPAASSVESVVSVLNPGDRPVTVTLRAFEEGTDTPVSSPEQRVDPAERATFNLTDLDVAADQVLLVVADGEVLVERLLTSDGGRSIAPGIPAR